MLLLMGSIDGTVCLFSRLYLSSFLYDWLTPSLCIVFWGTFFPGLDGFEEIKNPDPALFREYAPDIAAFIETGQKPAESVICTGKIKHIGSTYVDQWEYLKSQLPRSQQIKEAKLTLAAPNWYHFRYKEGKAYPEEVYANDSEYFADLAKAYQAELSILYDHGLRNVQIDDPNLAYFCSEKFLEGWKKDKLNTYTADELFVSYIEFYNDCLSERPEDMHVGVSRLAGH